MSSSELLVRPARLSDNDEVLGILPNNYAGFDYIYEKFVEFCHDPDYHPYVCVCDGKIVAFTCYVVMDNIALGCGGRVSTHMQHKGIASTLYTNAWKHLKEKRPNVVHESYTALLSPYHSAGLQKNPNKQLKLTWNTLPYVQAPPNVAVNIGTYVSKLPTPLPKVKKLTDVEARNIIQHQQTTLFPTNWVVYDSFWQAMPLSDQKLKDLVSKSSVLASFVDTTNSVLEAVSFSSHLRIKRGTRLDVWFYDTGRAHEPTLLAHVVKALQQALVVSPVFTLQVMIHFPLAFNHQSVQQLLKPLLGDKFSEKPFDSDCQAIAVLNLDVTN